MAVGVWVGVGGRFENGPEKGAAHFLEHILFRGSLKFSCNNSNDPGTYGSIAIDSTDKSPEGKPWCEY